MKISLVLLILFLNTSSYAQHINEDEKKIIKVIYESSPVSQYNMTEDRMQSTPSKSSFYEFMKGITDFYSLYINLEDRSSVYVLDSTVQNRPRGWENPSTTAALSDTVLFSIKSPKKETFKHEWIMNQTFYTEGEVGDLKWELTDDEKTIDGLKCYKAFSENYPMLTVWYTKEIPVSNGPSIYHGLPGLIVLAEDHFRTIQISNISYNNDIKNFRKLYKEKLQKFKAEKIKGNNYDLEPILIIKKGDLAKSRYRRYFDKPYRKD